MAPKLLPSETPALAALVMPAGSLLLNVRLLPAPPVTVTNAPPLVIAPPASTLTSVVPPKAVKSAPAAAASAAPPWTPRFWLLRHHTAYFWRRRRTLMPSNRLAVLVLCLVSAPAAADDLDVLQGKFAFNWHAAPAREKCRKVEGPLLADFKSKYR